MDRTISGKRLPEIKEGARPAAGKEEKTLFSAAVRASRSVFFESHIDGNG